MSERGVVVNYPYSGCRLCQRTDKHVHSQKEWAMSRNNPLFGEFCYRHQEEMQDHECDEEET